MNALRFRLNLSREQALRYYQGQASTVIVRAENGQSISFPAQHIRPFIDNDGVHGQFVIEFDSQNKFLGIRRL